MTLSDLVKPPAVSIRVSVGLLLLRIVAGLGFFFHGLHKFQSPGGFMGWMGPEAPVPGVLQAAAALAELGGGLLWIAGALTPVASLLIAITMTVAVHMHAVVRQDPFVASSPGQLSYEPALGYLSVAVLLLLAGPGRLSVDWVLFGGEKPK